MPLFLLFYKRSRLGLKGLDLCLRVLTEVASKAKGFSGLSYVSIMYPKFKKYRS